MHSSNRFNWNESISGPELHIAKKLITYTGEWRNYWPAVTLTGCTFSLLPLGPSALGLCFRLIVTTIVISPVENYSRSPVHQVCSLVFTRERMFFHFLLVINSYCLTTGINITVLGNNWRLKITHFFKSFFTNKMMQCLWNDKWSNTSLIVIANLATNPHVTYGISIVSWGKLRSTEFE